MSTFGKKLRECREAKGLSQKELAKLLKARGADLIDVSTGGLVPHAKIPVAPGFQVPFAARLRSEAAIPTAAVGLITQPTQAESIVAGGEADMVLVARAVLHDPYWPVHAAEALGVEASWPKQYLRGAPRHAPARAALEQPATL